MTEKEILLSKIEKRKKDLADYLKIAPILEVSEMEKERVTNQFLDDILNRQRRLNEE